MTKQIVKPLENDPLRRFYSSLLMQNTKSKMVINWCKKHGIYEEEMSKQLCKSVKQLSIKET